MKKLLIAVAATTLIGVSLWFFWLKPSPKQFFHDQATRISFNYSADLKPLNLNENDRRDKFVWRAENEPQQPPVLLTVRYEENLRQAAQLTRQQPLDLVLNGANKAFPQRFPGYQQLSERRFTLDGRPAAEVLFTYQNQKQTIKQRFMIVLRDDNTAFYITGQTPAEQFDELNRQYLDQTFESVNFQ